MNLSIVTEFLLFFSLNVVFQQVKYFLKWLLLVVVVQKLLYFLGRLGELEVSEKVVKLDILQHLH